MENLLIILILISVTIIAIYKIQRLYKNFKLEKKKKFEKEIARNELLKKYKLFLKNYANFIEKKIIEKVMQEENEQAEELYYLGVEKIKYKLYQPLYDFNSSIYLLYKKIIIDNLWINEPFHTWFYCFLYIFDRNELIIADPNGKAIIMNIRDSSNKEIRSKSYQVFSGKEVLIELIEKIFTKILKFDKDTSQDIIMTLFIFIINNSIHYQSKSISYNIIEEFLLNYELKDNVEVILRLIKENHESLNFINIALNEVYNTVETYPYNDTELAEPILVKTRIFNKSLRSI